MAVTILQSSLDLHESIAVDFTAAFGSTLKLYFEPILIACTNGVDNIGQKSYNFDLGGNNVPLHEGCIFCNGSGFKQEESYVEIVARTYFTQKEFKKLGMKIDIPEGSMITISLLNTLPNIQRCIYCVATKDNQGYGVKKYEKSGEYIPFGVRRGNEVLQMWKKSE